MVNVGPVGEPRPPADVSWVKMGCSCGCSDEKPCRYWRKQRAKRAVTVGAVGPADPSDLHQIGENTFLPDWSIAGCSCCTRDSPCRTFRRRLAAGQTAAARQALFDALRPEDREWLAEHVRLVTA